MKKLVLGLFILALVWPSVARSELYATVQGNGSGVYKFAADGTPTLLHAATSPYGLTWSATTGLIYFTELEGNGGQAFSMRPDGSDVTMLGQFTTLPHAVVAEGDYLYVGARATNVLGISRRPLAGGDFQTLPNSYAGRYFYDFVSAPSLERIYTAGPIGVDYYDLASGTFKPMIFYTNRMSARGIDLDQASQKIYWSFAYNNFGAMNSSINRANLDGSQIEGYGPAASDVSDVYAGVAINQATRTLYAGYGDEIRRFDLDDPAANPVTFANVGTVVSLAFVPNKPGDFDGDGDADGSDLNIWTEAYEALPDGDADGDGDSDGADFLTWQTGASGVAGVNAVPEPATWLLAAVCLLFFRRRN